MQNGVNTLLLDAEGTIVEYGGWDVDPVVIDKIKTLRENGLENVAIVTNAKIKDDKDDTSFLKLAWWADQIGADIVFTPQDSSERKPSPKMLLKALAHFGIKPDQALVIGDKLSSDIRAANFAGIASVYLEEYFGELDHWGDAVGRRPAEDIFATTLPYIFDEPWQPLFQPATEALVEVLERGDTRLTIAPVELLSDPKVSDETLELTDKIAGIGRGRRVILPDEVVDKIPDPWHASVTGPIKKFTTLPDWVDNYLKDHGNGIADILTKSRYPLGVWIAGLVVSEKYKAAHMLHTAAMLTDLFDGKLARKGKDGGTEEGGKLDNEADKFFTVVVDGALSVKVPSYRKHATVRAIRDEGMMKRVIRPFFDALDIDTSAIPASKLSTVLAMLDQNIMLLSLSLGREAGENEIMEWIATMAKIGSMAYSPVAYIKRDALKRRDEEMVPYVKEQLLLK